MRFLKFKSYPLAFWIILTGFAILFGLISLVNHYNFRTYAFDLGIFNNSLYDYAHFRWDQCTVMEPGFSNVLSDHFNLLPALFSPLYWISGSYTLLILQILAILWGSVGVFLWVTDLTRKSWTGLLAMVHFLTLWGVFSALAYDYHDNVIAAMLVPWFLLAIHRNRKALMLIIFVLILISKENMAFWMVFVCLGFLVHYRREKEKRNSLLVLTILAAVYFIVVMTWIMPSLADPGRKYLHFDYAALGPNFPEAIRFVVTNPIETLALLFKNHLSDPLYNGIKMELWLAVVLSGGVALLFRPAFLLMAVPVFAQKLFSDHYEYWGLNNHYSIELVPIITLALYAFISDIRNPRIQKIAAIGMLIVSIGASFSFLDHRISKHYKKANHRFYQKTHYVRHFEVNEIHRFLETIPDETAVCAQSMLVPHLAFREKIYTFPAIHDADLILLLPADSDTYPFSKTDYDARVSSLIKSGAWEVRPSPASMLVLKRKNQGQ